MTKIDPCDTMRNNLIAAALGLQACTKTDGTEVLVPGTDKRILIGNDAYLAKVALPATTAAQPLDLDSLEPFGDAELNELESVARAAPATWYGTYQIVDGISDEKAVELIEACSPDTILSLIAQARASQQPIAQSIGHVSPAIAQQADSRAPAPADERTLFEKHLRDQVRKDSGNGSGWEDYATLLLQRAPNGDYSTVWVHAGWEYWQARAAHQAAPASAQPAERQRLHEMHNDEGEIGWYFDCDGHYIDVERDVAGKYSIYFRNRKDQSEAWRDEAEGAQPDQLESVADSEGGHHD